MTSVPRAGDRNGDPTDATRPSGRWIPFEVRQPYFVLNPLVWRPGWDDAVRYDSLPAAANTIGLLWLDEESGR